MHIERTFNTFSPFRQFFLVRHGKKWLITCDDKHHGSLWGTIGSYYEITSEGKCKITFVGIIQFDFDPIIKRPIHYCWIAVNGRKAKEILVMDVWINAKSHATSATTC